MIYEYRNAAGEMREIHARAANRPPEYIVFDAGGAWRPADAGAVGHWARVYGCAAGCVKQDGSVKHAGQKLPVSLSMPWDKREGKIVNRHGHQVREHKDGTYSTMEGERIVDSTAARRKHMENCGHVNWD